MADDYSGLGVRPDAPAGAGGVESPAIPPSANLSPQERRVWEYITGVLQRGGVKHITSGIAITMVCKAYMNWIQLEKAWAEAVKNNGNSPLFETRNGEPYYHPMLIQSRKAWLDLQKVLPDAALTIPSLTMVESKTAPVSPQDDLFAAFADMANNPAANFNSGSGGRTIQ